MDYETYAILNKKFKNVTLAYSYKGSVATVNDLPDNADLGDLYTVDGTQYVWDGEDWVAMSISEEVIDNLFSQGA